MSWKFHVQISIPSGKAWHPRFARSLDLLIKRFSCTDPQIPIALSTVHDEGGKHNYSRRDLVKVARAQTDPPVTHVLFMAPDIQFPAETMQRLFEYQYPIVTGLGKLARDKFNCEEVQSLGFGCTLVSLEALDILGDDCVIPEYLEAPVDRPGMLYLNHDLAKDIHPAIKLRKPGKKRQIAIIGKAKHCRISAPFYNPDWEIWALGFDTVPRIDRRFELHNDPLLAEVLEGMTVRDRLRASPCPVMMQRVHEDIPKSVRYPLEAIVKDIGVDYFGSTFGLMIAQAIHEKADKIGIWGVDLNTTEEYSYQKPNAEFLIGVALGRNIHVYLPPRTSLLTAPGRYGWDEEAYVRQIKLAEAKMEEIVLARIGKRGDAVLAKAFGDNAVMA